MNASASKDHSSNSQILQAILSHREALSKQQSFNSPRSLQSKLQLTTEKIQKSIDGSSITKGRRKMVMLDEADPSKQSLNFGLINNNGSILNANSSVGAPIWNGCSVGGRSSGNTTPLRG